MALTLDYTTLDQLGLGSLPLEEKKKLLTHILETLEMRVGTTLASKMSEQQLDEFEKMMPADQDGQEVIKQKEQIALHWLETNFPSYKDVVSNELDKLLQEIRGVVPQILAAAQQTSQQQPQSSQSPPPPQQPPQTLNQPPTV